MRRIQKKFFKKRFLKKREYKEKRHFLHDTEDASLK